MARRTITGSVAQAHAQHVVQAPAGGTTDAAPPQPLGSVKVRKKGTVAGERATPQLIATTERVPDTVVKLADAFRRALGT